MSIFHFKNFFDEYKSGYHPGSRPLALRFLKQYPNPYPLALCFKRNNAFFVPHARMADGRLLDQSTEKYVASNNRKDTFLIRLPDGITEEAAYSLLPYAQRLAQRVHRNYRLRIYNNMQTIVRHLAQIVEDMSKDSLLCLPVWHTRDFINLESVAYTYEGFVLSNETPSVEAITDLLLQDAIETGHFYTGDYAKALMAVKWCMLQLCVMDESFEYILEEN